MAATTSGLLEVLSQSQSFAVTALHHITYNLQLLFTKVLTLTSCILISRFLFPTTQQALFLASPSLFFLLQTPEYTLGQETNP